MSEFRCPLCSDTGWVRVYGIRDECPECDCRQHPPEPTDEQTLRQDGQPEIFDDE